MYLYHDQLKPLDHTQVISNHDVTSKTNDLCPVQGGEYLSKQVCCI